MDIEWVKDGVISEVFVVQVRLEMVELCCEVSVVKMWCIKKIGCKILFGVSIGEVVVVGKVCIIESLCDMECFVDGVIFVIQMIDLDWVFVMWWVVVIIIDQGGCILYVVIVSCELGFLVIVGVGNVMYLLYDEQEVMVFCVEGWEGFVYEGIVDFVVEEIDFGSIFVMCIQVMLNFVNFVVVFWWW